MCASVHQLDEILVRTRNVRFSYNYASFCNCWGNYNSQILGGGDSDWRREISAPPLLCMIPWTCHSDCQHFYLWSNSSIGVRLYREVITIKANLKVAGSSSEPQTLLATWRRVWGKALLESVFLECDWSGTTPILKIYICFLSLVELEYWLADVAFFSSLILTAQFQHSKHYQVARRVWGLD